MVRTYIKKCVVCKRKKKMFKARVTCSRRCALAHKNNDKLRNSRRKKK